MKTSHLIPILSDCLNLPCKLVLPHRTVAGAAASPWPAVITPQPPDGGRGHLISTDPSPGADGAIKRRRWSLDRRPSWPDPVIKSEELPKTAERLLSLQCWCHISPVLTKNELALGS